LELAKSSQFQAGPISPEELTLVLNVGRGPPGF
jgi:hypothetical protein